MNNVDEVLLAAAAKSVISAISWHEHNNISRVEATYESKMLGGETVLVPKIVIEMKKDCCCKS